VNLFSATVCVALFCPALVWGTTIPADTQQSDALSLESHIPLPNVKGRIDHLSVDTKGQRLFVLPWTTTLSKSSI